MSSRMNSDSTGPEERFFGALLRLFPAEFRERFAGEMREIARAFADADAAGGGFANAAAEVFGALAGFKDAETFELDAVLTALGPQAAPTPPPN